MISGFVGRAAELGVLGVRLERVRGSGRGTAVALRGRRQVGKSRLVQEFCDRAGVPYLYFTAVKGASPKESIASLLSDLREFAMPRDRELVPGGNAANWLDAFRVVALALPERPCIVVIDESPWLAEQDQAFEGALQVAWDRLLSVRPVLLLLLGSDLHMMERLTGYDRPFYGRADNLVLGPLNPAETSKALAIEPQSAVDAHLITGGLPGILRSWPTGDEPMSFVQRECADPAASVFSVPESSLLAEFPSPDQALRVLEAVGGGNRTYANIAAAAGGSRVVPSGSLTPLLRRLVEDKRVLAIDEPLSTRPGRPALYRVADSNLRMYLAIGRTAHDYARRGRPDEGFALLRRRWPAWRGRAVEPLVRESLALACAMGSTPWPGAEVVGGWWNRQFDPEVDLVGADRSPVAGAISFAGSIKWLDTTFDGHDLTELTRNLRAIPGADPGATGIAVVSRSGLAPGLSGQVDLLWGPRDIVEAWDASA